MACHGPEQWTNHLPLVMLGLRAVLRRDLGWSMAELVYGAPIRLPDELFSTYKTACQNQPYLQRLHNCFRDLQPVQPRSAKQHKFEHPDLTTATYVFLR